MIIEGIRNLLGEDLAKQVEGRAEGQGQGRKGRRLVIGNDGTFVPAEKYNGANSGKASAENALKAAAEALKAVGGSGDPAKIADDVKVAKEKFDTLQTTHAAELAKISKRSALQMALNGKVYDPSDIIGLLDMDKIEVSDDGSLKTDLEGLLKPIKESKAYLFKEDPAKTPPSTARRPRSWPEDAAGGRQGRRPRLPVTHTTENERNDTQWQELKLSA